MRNTLKVYERLKKEQHITTLFRTGKAFSVFPLRVVYLIHDAAPGSRPATYPLMAGFSVPKKKFRKSVDRHRVRRLLAEAWRTRKGPIITAMPEGRSVHVFLIATTTELPDFAQVAGAMDQVVEKLLTIVQKPAHA